MLDSESFIAETRGGGCLTRRASLLKLDGWVLDLESFIAETRGVGA